MWGLLGEEEETVLDDIKAWFVNDASNVMALEASASMASEFLLEEVLVKNPDLLMPGLTLVGRQTPTEGGPLDLLGVDSDGRLVVFELKRGTLSRDAVAQIIDYASDLDSKSDIALAEHITANSGVGGIPKIDDFESWYSDNRDVASLGALRPLRLFLIGLGADDRTERMVRFLAGNSGMDISVLASQGFMHEGKTLLARQVEVEGATEPRGPSGRRDLSAAEKKERLEKRIEEYGVTDLLTAAREMFHEKWHSCRENIGPTSIGFLLPERTESGRRTPSYARIDIVAKNYGQRQISGPICVTLDAHSLPARGALERMVAPMTTDPDLVITGPTVATLPQPSAAEMLSGVWGIPA